jgi:hypothetical protein
MAKRAITAVEGVPIEGRAEYLYERNKSRITELDMKHVQLDERLKVVQQDVADLKLSEADAREKRSDMRRVLDGVSVQVGQLVASAGKSYDRKHDWLKTVVASALAFGAAILLKGIKC